MGDVGDVKNTYKLLFKQKQEDKALVNLPTVDTYDQKQIRQRIVIERLNKT